MKTRSSVRQAGVPLGLPPLIVLLAIGSALFHAITVFGFIFANAIGEPNFGEDPSLHEPPYSETEFFVLLGLLILIPIRKTTTSSPNELTSAVKRPF